MLKNKIYLLILKYLPLFMACIYCINTILALHDKDCVFLDYLAGTPFILVLYLIYESFVFKFCSYHRVFLYYILYVNLLNITDCYTAMSIDDVVFYRSLLYVIFICSVIYSVLYLKEKRKQKKNKKSEHI